MSGAQVNYLGGTYLGSDQQTCEHLTLEEVLDAVSGGKPFLWLQVRQASSVILGIHVLNSIVDELLRAST